MARRALAAAWARASAALSLSRTASIRLGLVAVQKALVVLVKLGFQHSQPVKFREEYSRRFGRGPYRILGVVVLPGKKHLMRLVEIKVVEQAKPLIERSTYRRCIGRGRGRQQGRQTQRR